MYASAICSILQPTDQMRPSTAPLVRKLLLGVFTKNPSARGLVETWGVKNVIDFL